ncbi:unnamed protein product, partial [Iphiclides podalirius]
MNDESVSETSIRGEKWRRQGDKRMDTTNRACVIFEGNIANSDAGFAGVDARRVGARRGGGGWSDPSGPLSHAISEAYTAEASESTGTYIYKMSWRNKMPY